MRVVDQVSERFPDRALLIRRLYLRDEGFRAVCEDLALTLSSLRRFEARPDAHLRPEVDDYRTVLCELEAELVDCLDSVDGR
ncbi:hypothetical protein ACW9UR_19315 [Halovulum sp. GXIMD14794]